MTSTGHSSAIVVFLFLSLTTDSEGQILQRSFGSEPVCSSCSIQLATKFTFDLPQDSLSFGYHTSFLRLRNGGYIAWDLPGRRTPLVFDSSGRFLRVSLPSGVGPGEIRNVNALIRASGDSIWIVDGSRKHVFSPEMAFLRQEPVRASGYNFIAGPNGEVITSGVVGSASAAGFPLHMRNNAFELTRSFGTDDPTIDPRRLRATNDDVSMLLQRTFTPDGPQSFWVYSDFRFVLERYDFKGQLLARYHRLLDGWYRDGSRRKPSPGEFPGLKLSAVQSSSRVNLVWLVYHDPRPGFVIPEGRIDYAKIIEQHDLVIEAFDPQQSRVVAVSRWPGLMAVKIDQAPDMIAVLNRVSADVIEYRAVLLRLQ